MRVKETIAIVLVLLSTVGTLWAIFAYEETRQTPNKITLLARTPDKGNWTPNTIEIRVGQTVNLEIRNVDVVSHGFYLPAFDITVREIKAGGVEQISITPDKRGNFPFYCSIWCSDFHMYMRGDLIVK